MAIDPNELELWVGDEGITDSSTLGLSLSWEARHTVIGEVIDRGVLARRVAKQSDLLDAWGKLIDRAEQKLKDVQSFHEPISAIGGHSLFDVDLILDGWLTDGDGYEHPICGTLAGPVPSSLVDRLSFILVTVAPPPAWFWATGGTGEVDVKCVAVSGAGSYNVYDGEELIGNVPDATWNTVSGLSAGVYSLRMAAVVGVQVGILSFPLAVEVT